MSKNENTAWIRASLLPDDGKLCICTDGDAMWFGSYSRKRWWHEHFDDFGVSGLKQRRVFFWMYAPEFPK